MNAIASYLKTKAGEHLFALVIGAAVVIGGRSWLAEHDARLQADNAVKVAQTQIDDLKTEQSAVADASAKQVSALQRAAARVTTAPEAIAALPSVTPAATAANPAPALDAQAVPDAPNRATVNAVPLFQDLSAGKQARVEADSCNEQLGLQKKIDSEKDTEITALKKKPGFWHRAGGIAKDIAIGVAIGYIVHK